jgi:signal transduction histidine kinase
MQYFAIYLVYIAVLARAIGLNYETAPIPTVIWILLAIFGIVLFSERVLTGRFPRYPRLYAVIQSILVITMLYLAPTLDFLPMLFFPLSFQVVWFFHDLVGFIWIGVFSLAMMGMILTGLEWQAGLSMVLANTGANVLMGSFAHLISRTEQRQQENQRLFGELQEAYHQLKDFTAQAEALAAATERHQLVRELHDSLTQTLFSMNLAVQSAQLSVEDDPQQANEHLLRLQTLARNAASEVQALTGQNSIHTVTKGGLSAAIQRLADERMAQDGLNVSVEVTGKRTLSLSTEENLYRIAQEALNNIARHAQTKQAQVRLCLESPHAYLDIIDNGCGFDMEAIMNTRGFGLAGMTERAAEIGWEMSIESYPGKGTHIHVEEKSL